MPYMDGMGKEFLDPNHRCFFVLKLVSIYGCFQKIVGFLSQIIHLFIGFSMIFTIHFGGKPPIFRNTHIYQ